MILKYLICFLILTFLLFLALILSTAAITMRMKRRPARTPAILRFLSVARLSLWCWMGEKLLPGMIMTGI